MTSAAFLEDFHHVATIGATRDNGGRPFAIACRRLYTFFLFYLCI